MKEGWEYKKLGEVCGKCSNIKWDDVSNEASYRYIDLTSVDRGDLHIHNPQNIRKDNAPSRAKQIIKAGDVIFATTRPTLRRVSIIEEQYDGDICSTGFCVLRHNEVVKSRFVFYALLYDGFYKYIEPLQTGANYPAVTDNVVKNYIIPVPPLPEQQRIVDYLDSAFAKIDAMKANAEKALNEAKALFQASLKEMLEPKEGWEEKKLSEVVNILNGYAFPSKAFGDNQELKVVKITNVGVGSFIEDISTLPQKMFIQDVCLKEGDIVIALTRTIISEGLKRAIIPSSYDGAMLNQRVASLRFSGKINMSFLYYYLGCSIVSDYVWLHVNTLMQPNLSIKDLKSMPVCIPSLPEQQSIVETLDSLKSKVDRLQANYDKISQECDALKQAILRQVFE